MFQNGGNASIKVRFLMEQSVSISSNTFWGPNFLKKGPLKLQKGAFDVLVAVFVSFAYNPAVLCFVGW